MAIDQLPTGIKIDNWRYSNRQLEAELEIGSRVILITSNGIRLVVILICMINSGSHFPAQTPDGEIKCYSNENNLLYFGTISEVSKNPKYSIGDVIAFEIENIQQVL